MNYDFKKLDDKISSATSHLESEIASLRTGRANPALLENIRVEAYGVSSPLKNIASIITEDSKTLLVEPWDKSLIGAIEKAIAAGGIGSMPVVAKGAVRISLPPLTEERRRSLLKVSKEKLEGARIALRQSRDEVWKDIQDRERRKEISEDNKFRFKEEMENRIKKAGEKLESISVKKEKEIME